MKKTSEEKIDEELLNGLRAAEKAGLNAAIVGELVAAFGRLVRSGKVVHRGKYWTAFADETTGETKGRVKRE